MAHQANLPVDQPGAAGVERVRQPGRVRRARALAPAVWLSRRVTPGRESLLHDEAFRNWWLTRLACQTAQGALLYALLIMVIDKTDASFFSSLFVVCSLVPALVFGLPGGIVSDRLPKRPLLIGLNLARFAFVLPLVLREVSLGGIFATTIGIWIIHQFYSPTEGTSIAALVPRGRYAEAQSLSNLCLTFAQLIGLVIMAPLFLKVAPPQVLFAIVASLYFVAGGLATLLPRMDDHLQPGTGRPVQSIGSVRTALLVGWRSARSDRASFGAMADDVTVGIGFSALIVIVPFYLERVLDTAKENTVFVFAPAALGLVTGYRMAPRISRLIGGERAATIGLVTFAACVAGLGFAPEIYIVLTDGLSLPFVRIADAVSIQPLVIVAMLVSIPAGFASAIVNVAARSVILERTPPASRSQVVATQSLINNVGAIVPAILAGIAMDRFGVTTVAVAIAILIAAIAVAVHVAVRHPMPLVSPSAP